MQNSQYSLDWFINLYLHVYTHTYTHTYIHTYIHTHTHIQNSQYSLDWFINLYVASMKDSEPNNDLSERVAILIDHFSYSLYRNVCRSLFEKDKLLYSFLVCTRLMLATNKISSDELRFLLSGVGGVLTGKQPDKPSDWVPDRSWTEILQMAQLSNFSDFPTMFVASLPEVWRACVVCVCLCACVCVCVFH